LGIGDWGLGNPQSPIPNPQIKEICYILIALLLKCDKITISILYYLLIYYILY